MVAQIETNTAADGGSGGGGMVGGSPPAVDESQDQLEKTKTLICALNFLSRNLPIPPDVFDAVSSIYHSGANDVDVGDEDASPADVDNLSVRVSCFSILIEIINLFCFGFGSFFKKFDSFELE